MTTIATLTAKLGLDSSGFDKGVDSAKDKGKGLGGFLSNAFSFATGGAILGGLNSIKDAAGGLIGSMVGGNAEFERYNNQFKTLLGSAGAAKQRMAELAQFGAETPFELPEVVKADQVLTNFGLHAENTKQRFGFTSDEIQRIAGDAAAGVGVGFDEMSTYLGKFSAGSTGEVISRFQELGIVTKQQLTDMGLSFDKGGSLVINSQEEMDKATGILMTAMKSKYGGLMAQQSGTFEGMVSNLNDWKDGTLRTLGAPIFEVLKDKLGTVLEFLNKPETKAALDRFAHLLADGIGGAMDWLSNKGIPALVDGWNIIQPGLKTVINLVDKITAGFQKNGLMGAIDALLPEMQKFGEKLGPMLGEWAQKFLDWLPGATVKLLTGALDMFGKFAAWLIERGPDILRTLGEWEIAFGKWAITKGLPALGRALLSIGAGLWDYLKDKWNQAFAADSIGGSIVDSIKSGITAKWDALKGWFFDLLASIIPGGAGALSALGISAPGRALGGQVMAGQAYTVGELGRETFIPAVNGTIVPSGASSAPVVHVHVAGSVTAERDLAQTIRQVLLDFKRSNTSVGLA